MNAVVEVLDLGPESLKRPGHPESSVPARPRLAPAETAFAMDGLRPPFWRSAGMAIAVELLLMAGLGLWVMTGQLSQTTAPPPVTSVKLVAPPRTPPKPVVQPPPPVHPTSDLTPVLPHLVPLTPVAGGLPVPRALFLPHPSASHPPAAQGAINPLALYTAILRQQVRAALVVPSIAREMGLRGRTLVEFRLRPDGQMLWARVVRSSGSGILDHAALKAVRGADFPPFEPRMTRVNTTFALWVHLNVSA